MPDMDRIVECQKEHLLELCNFHAKLRDMRDSFRRTSLQLEDAGDTWMDADEALVAVGSLIADLVVYVSEYEKEARGEKEDAIH